MHVFSSIQFTTPHTLLFTTHNRIILSHPEDVTSEDEDNDLEPVLICLPGLICAMTYYMPYSVRPG